MKSISPVEASSEKVKATWDRRLTMILCDLCIKEILIGNRPGTHFKREGWVKIVNNFEKETGKPYTQKQLKNRWDLLKKEWKLWKKLKEKDTGLGWNPIKGTVDASDDWWESRLKGIVATGDKAWAPSSGIMPTDFIEHGYNETLEEIEEENEVEVVPMLRHPILKNEKKKSSKQVGGAAKLSLQIDKLCNTAESMSNATSRLNPVTDPFGIPKAYKVLEELSEEVPETSDLYFFALKLIANKDKRTLFLTIPDRVRVWWLTKEMEDSSKLTSLLVP
ncbi:hypothetical protein V6N12_010610 [Hibiscus sabdariffa]|uniref:Myb/SANT-like domain-containing protein n=1 Tax=Hibiscus sabdariffa TaxID=183260 RepID=A0ABR2EM49_9ROSI